MRSQSILVVTKTIKQIYRAEAEMLAVKCLNFDIIISAFVMSDARALTFYSTIIIWRSSPGMACDAYRRERSADNPFEPP